MKFPEFVALRYFFQRKNWNVVHIISIISLVGIGVASMALIIVLSVFNGFTDVAERMLAFSNPDIIIESQKGKSFSLNDVDAEKIANVVGVKNCVNVVSETVLMSFADRQTIVNMIGTTEDYTKLNSIDSTMRIGTFSLGSSSAPNAVLGLSLAINLGIGKGADKMNLMLHFCSPKNNSSLSFVPEENLNEDKAVYSGSFMTAGDMDADVAFVPLAFAQNLLEYEQDRISSIHVSVEDDKQVNKVKEKIINILPKDMIAKNRFEQDPIYFKIVKAEKLAVYLILSFIIFIASFNVMGAVSLFAMVKRNDIKILSSMGANNRNIRKIFFMVGMIMSSIGCVSGLLLGSAFCFLQQQFGLIKIGSNGFVIDSFPVSLCFTDIINVVILVMIIASLCIGIMVRRIKIENK
ncbi:MAG: FtsX-like permease family protein [Bacteroidales bacterium]|nr:FtsX-like permease family protein [Bacteroidales bacterium]